MRRPRTRPGADTGQATLTFVRARLPCDCDGPQPDLRCSFDFPPTHAPSMAGALLFKSSDGIVSARKPHIHTRLSLGGKCEHGHVRAPARHRMATRKQSLASDRTWPRPASRVAEKGSVDRIRPPEN